MGIYKFGNKYLPSAVRRSSNLGHIFREKSVSYRLGNTVYQTAEKSWRAVRHNSAHLITDLKEIPIISNLRFASFDINDM
jgi:hypothetical protein